MYKHEHRLKYDPLGLKMILKRIKIRFLRKILVILKIFNFSAKNSAAFYRHTE